MLVRTCRENKWKEWLMGDKRVARKDYEGQELYEKTKTA